MSTVTETKVDKRTLHKLPDSLKKNLWQPGQSGNPGGRVKVTLSLKKELRKRLEADPAEVQNFLTNLLKNANNGNPVAIRVIMDAIDPEPKAGDAKPQLTDEERTQRFMELLSKARAAAEATLTGGEPERQEAIVAVSDMAEAHGDMADGVEMP